MGEAQSTESTCTYTDREKVAVLGLWSVPGVGPKTLQTLREWAGGRLDALLAVDVGEFANSPELGFNVTLRQRLMEVPSLEAAAESVFERAKQSLQKLCFIGEAGYPAKLATIVDPPPVLFTWGELGPERKRVALVGSRKPSNHFVGFAQRFAADLARAGIGVISGGAYGVDQACHTGAIAAGGETWAFVGSALDQLDPVPWSQVSRILRARGVILSEYPPGVRADTHTFPRRNRLISGASDATVILRAAARSGTLSTAEHALRQRRPLFAVPGDPDEATSAGCNAFISNGAAKAVTSAEAVLAALQVTRGAQPAPVGPAAELLSALSPEARAVYAALAGVPQELEAIGEAAGLSSGALTAGLVELELKGLCQQLPGKVYEKS